MQNDAGETRDLIMRDDARVGISFCEENAPPYVVEEIVPGTWAASQGIQIGDTLIFLNGKPCADMQPPDFIKEITKARPITLTFLMPPVVKRRSVHPPLATRLLPAGVRLGPQRVEELSLAFEHFAGGVEGSLSAQGVRILMNAIGMPMSTTEAEALNQEARLRGDFMLEDFLQIVVGTTTEAELDAKFANACRALERSPGLIREADLVYVLSSVGLQGFKLEPQEIAYAINVCGTGTGYVATEDLLSFLSNQH
eukprot:gnl/MRDRNA2_/MRDRNA2_58481_c0_seq1.p1 gnl/MRDRNA2_/MRDRNA2_58481_c0~~gnl/MRDRNA2_/MRDRNA2_58481_c0_seq1.p1  ORF type:complete len:254 (-),score=46.17 gnl/MRDRNA2_/MRDRNA2_58481_c0_seq1:104-865(-)